MQHSINAETNKFDTGNMVTLVKASQKNPNRWYIGHHTLNNPLTKIEVTSIGNILEHKVPTYSRFYWLIQVSSNSIGLLFLAPFFGVHWLIIYTIE